MVLTAVLVRAVQYCMCAAISCATRGKNNLTTTTLVRTSCYFAFHESSMSLRLAIKMSLESLLEKSAREALGASERLKTSGTTSRGAKKHAPSKQADQAAATIDSIQVRKGGTKKVRK